MCPSKERLPGVPPGPRMRFSVACCLMSRATPASTAVPQCTSATIVSTASTPFGGRALQRQPNVTGEMLPDCCQHLFESDVSYSPL